MRYHIRTEGSVIHDGDTGRLESCMRRAENGDRIVIGFLGGSITQGSLATSPESCYAYLTYLWWKRQFPQADIHYVNAGIGGTTSHFGVARVKEDLLCHRPDVVFVEFSVNDENTGHFQETYEGLLRVLLKEEDAPAVVLLHNMFYDDGRSAEEIHSALGRHYALPCISMRRSIYTEVAAGRIQACALTPDNLHPNDAGHELLSETVTAFLQNVWSSRKNNEISEKGRKAAISPAMTANGYERTSRFRNDNIVPVRCEGFDKDEDAQTDIRDVFRKGWRASEKEAGILFEVSGEAVAVQYRKTVRRPSPIAVAVVDGREGEAVVLDSNFEEDWGDCLYLQLLMEHAEPGKHTVEIRIVETPEKEEAPFYLVSLLVSGQSAAISAESD